MKNKLSAVKKIGSSFGVIAISMSIWALVEAWRLVIPFYNTLLVVNTTIAVLGLACTLLGVHTRVRSYSSGPLNYLGLSFRQAYLIPFALGAVSYGRITSSDIRTCHAEVQWSRLFRAKDESAIRAIQNHFKCCGFNSLRDRAWPFPARGIEASACEYTLGYSDSCGQRWQHAIFRIAMVCFIANLFNLLMLFCIMCTASSSAINITLESGKQGTDEQDNHEQSLNEQARLLSVVSRDIQETFAEEQRRRERRDRLLS